MATSLSIAKRNPSASETKFGQEAKRFLMDLGITKHVTDGRIWIDPNGTVSWKGKIIRTKDGKLIPPPQAKETRQAKATRELEQSAANKRIRELKSQKVRDVQELKKRQAEIRKAKAQLPPPPPKRQAAPTTKPDTSAISMSRVVDRPDLARPKAPESRPTKPVQLGPPSRPQGRVPRGLQQQPTQQAPQVVPLRAAATVIDGTIVLFLSE